MRWSCRRLHAAACKSDIGVQACSMPGRSTEGNAVGVGGVAGDRTARLTAQRGSACRRGRYAARGIACVPGDGIEVSIAVCWGRGKGFGDLQTSAVLSTVLSTVRKGCLIDFAKS